MDRNIFSIIASALGLAVAGGATRDNPEYDAHLKELDDKLQNDEAHEAVDNTAQSARLDVIEQGLQTIAASLPAGAASSDATGASSSDATGAGSVGGTTPGDTTTGGPAPAGSDTTTGGPAPAGSDTTTGGPTPTFVPGIPGNDTTTGGPAPAGGDATGGPAPAGGS